MLSHQEIELLSNPANRKYILKEEIDISRLYFGRHSSFIRGGSTRQTYIETALVLKDFAALHIYLQCINADQALNELLDVEQCRANYLKYLISTECGKEGLNVLAQCQKRNNIIEEFYDIIISKPITDSESLNKYCIVFKDFLEKTRIIRTSFHVNKNIDSLHYTALEEAILTRYSQKSFSSNMLLERNVQKKSSSTISNNIFRILSRDNPYLDTAMKNDNEKLTALLKEIKTQDSATQQQLQITALFVTQAPNINSFDIIPKLLDAGMSIYPTYPIYTQSLLHYFLCRVPPASMHLKSLLIKMICLCLDTIKPSISKDVLQETFMGKNLLELAFEAQNEEIISRLKKAGALLPKADIQEKKEEKQKPNIFVEAIEEGRLPYFISQLDAGNDQQLIQAAEYCIKNYEKSKTPVFLSTLLTNKSHQLKTRKEGTLADFALESKQLQLLSQFETYGILPSEKKSSLPKEKKEHVPIDILCDFVRTGNVKQVKALIATQEYASLFNQRSSEDLTLTELAVIYSKFDVFAILVENDDDYGARSDCAFDILNLEKIKTLKKQYKKHIQLASVLDLAIKSYLEDGYQRNTNEGSLALKTLILTIAKGKLRDDTLKALANHKGFREKVFTYLKNLSSSSELDAILSINKGKSLQEFFADQKHEFFSRGDFFLFATHDFMSRKKTLDGFISLYAGHRARNEAAKKQCALSTIQDESSTIGGTTSISSSSFSALLPAEPKEIEPEISIRLYPSFNPDYLRQEGEERIFSSSEKVSFGAHSSSIEQLSFGTPSSSIEQLSFGTPSSSIEQLSFRAHSPAIKQLSSRALFSIEPLSFGVPHPSKEKLSLIASSEAKQKSQEKNDLSIYPTIDADLEEYQPGVIEIPSSSSSAVMLSSFSSSASSTSSISDSVLSSSVSKSPATSFSISLMDPSRVNSSLLSVSSLHASQFRDSNKNKAARHAEPYLAPQKIVLT